MIDVFVVRGAGDNRGDDIVDPLITDISVALARGQNEIDAATPIDRVTLETVHREYSTGQLVEVSDGDYGTSWRGKISGFTIVVEGPEVISTISVERPR